MRLLTLFKKTMLENLRDWKIIILTVTFAPFFILLMYLYYGDTTKPYRIILINKDRGTAAQDSTTFNAGKELIAEMKKAKYPDGKNIFKIESETDIDRAKESLKDKSADLAVVIPENFSSILMDIREGKESPPVLVKTLGDPANLKYITAAAFSDALVYQYAVETTGRKGPLDFLYETISSKKSLSEFDLYIPGLLVLALMMLMFTAAASMIKEKDKGTIVRLQLSKMTISEFFTSISIAQVIIGLLALGLSYLTAVALGYSSSGSLVNMLVVGAVSCLSIVAVSLVVAGFLRTIFDLMTIGCFPFFILMFFSGGMFPLPSLTMFSIGTRAININDILPTSHTTAALNKILNFNAGLGDIAFEIAAIVILTLCYFFIGFWLFRKRHLRAN